jgi:hypothetical protein
MKVYVVTYDSASTTPRNDKIFLNEDSAQKYCEEQNAVDNVYYHEYTEFEVDES